jgi:hypothetical protein
MTYDNEFLLIACHFVGNLKSLDVCVKIDSDSDSTTRAIAS